jgi:hypothetical protein
MIKILTFNISATDCLIFMLLIRAIRKFAQFIAQYSISIFKIAE